MRALPLIAFLTLGTGPVLAQDWLGDTGIQAADPSVIVTQDGFVAVESRDGRELFIRQAPTLEALSTATPVRIWSDRVELGEVWAPELVFRDGRYEVYFAAGSGSDHRMYRIASDRPASHYGHASPIALPDDKWAIDGLPFSFSDQSYFLWSGWEGDDDGRQSLYLAAIDESGAVLAPRVRINTSDRRWENVAGELPSINEGPQPIVDPAGQLHVVYSANGSWGWNYCLADLRLADKADPLDPAAWSKSPGCLFGANPATLAEDATLATAARGTGHLSFILPNGDAEARPGPDPAPFLYHGVPAGEEPEDFWEARHWYAGTYRWQPDATYRSATGTDRGWTLRFSE